MSEAPRVSELVEALRALVNVTERASKALLRAEDLLEALDAAVVPHPDDVGAAADGLAARVVNASLSRERDRASVALSAVLGLRAGGPEGNPDAT